MIGHADKYEASKTPGMATDITDIQNSSQKLRVSKIVAKIWLRSDRAIRYHYHRSLSLNTHLSKHSLIQIKKRGHTYAHPRCSLTDLQRI